MDGLFQNSCFLAGLSIFIMIQLYLDFRGLKLKNYQFWNSHLLGSSTKYMLWNNMYHKNDQIDFFEPFFLSITKSHVLQNRYVSLDAQIYCTTLNYLLFCNNCLIHIMYIYNIFHSHKTLWSETFAV